MLIEAEQHFDLNFPGTRPQALAFVRDPARALSRVRFLQHLKADGGGEGGGGEVRAVLAVQMPLLGTVTLPLHSRLIPTPDGARLDSLPLEGERAWIELSGAGTAAQDGTLHYDFRFVAHLDAPSAEGWGGAAFEKMIRAAAARTLTRLAQELPAGIAAALPEPRDR
ncbi:DUF3809 domain-containing protein [Deinococcus sp.]|uniref:DUF3809 domain-containing protein n=1 Tax=Deinococcus sp. TaxID=47478 RepID=UPI003CC51174